MISLVKPTSQIYFENVFGSNDLEWKTIYTLPRKVTRNTYMRAFQYKILNNTLYLNKKCFIFGTSKSPLCSYCNLFDETVFHLFCECFQTQLLWKNLQNYFANNISLPSISPQAAIFGFLKADQQIFAISNHLLLILKLHLYKHRPNKILNIKLLLKDITKVKNTEKWLSFVNERRSNAYKKKWGMIENKLE